MEQYAKAIKVFEPWLKTHPNPNLQINILVANAYAQLKHFRKALPYVKKAIAQSKKPKEDWYQLNLALYFELEDYSSASDILKTMIRLYPDNKQYWHQLSSTYQQLQKYKKAVSIKHLAYKKGFITVEKDILELANLFLYVNSPYKAAKTLEKEFSLKKIKHTSKNWEILANAWTMAKEFDHAIEALETASSLNSKGSLYLQLGQIYVEQEKWSQAIKSLKKALNKGGLKNAGAAHLLLGMSYYELNEIKIAKESFLKASKFSKSKKSAKQWVEYINKSG
jgi:tetratricopeptide (TPR) repeat protein